MLFLIFSLVFCTLGHILGGYYVSNVIKWLKIPNEQDKFLLLFSFFLSPLLLPASSFASWPLSCLTPHVDNCDVQEKHKHKWDACGLCVACCVLMQRVLSCCYFLCAVFCVSLLCFLCVLHSYCVCAFSVVGYLWCVLFVNYVNYGNIVWCV